MAENQSNLSSSSSNQDEMESISGSDTELNMEISLGGKTEPQAAHGEEGQASLAGKDVEDNLPLEGERCEACGSNTEVENVMDRLLKKQQRELMFELRRLQHGERPVTGQGRQEAVEGFLTRMLNPNDTALAEPPQNARPESVIVEVNALVERRPVSSLLQGSGFRRNLENALRGAFSRHSGSLPTPARSQSPLVRHSSSQSPVVRPSATDSQETVPPPPPLPVNEQLASPSRQPVEQSDHPSSTHRLGLSAYQLRQGELSLRHTPRPASPQLHVPEQRGAARAQNWLQENVPQPADPRHQQQMGIWDTIEQAHHEAIISDISELVQRELVTSTLESQFRGVLERRMRNQLDSRGIDGRRVQHAVLSLPSRGSHQRNDFSDLGIIPPHQQQALSDEASVISATAAVTVPYIQSNAAMNHEIRSLKGQLQEMKNMMKLSFDLQLDIQRSIRQEVAAALSQVAGGARQPQVAATQPVSDTQCLICLDSSVDTVLYQCGHMCVCHSCGLQLRQRGAHCPMCRAPIRDIIRAYKSNANEQ